ncbi:MAG: CRISPR-associated endonuclease Cas3'', partial [Ruminococcaceae bacterium]|nr:CRISPR-associated endonuclease Cas3'' [Oscillospiraceae bacterium]
MEYFAHKNSCGELQTVICHLKNVAAIASDFSAEIFKPIAHETGMLHDIGKYSAAFQRRLQGSAERFEHSTCGALECVRYAPNPRKRIEQYFIAYMMAYCIAGHHTGLPDGGTAADDPDNDNTLQSRLKRKDRYYGSATSYSAYEDEVTVNIPCAEAVTDELICSAKDNTEFI